MDGAACSPWPEGVSLSVSEMVKDSEGKGRGKLGP